MKIKFYILSCMFASMVVTSCDSLLDIDPPTDAMTVEELFSTKEGIKIAETGLYAKNFLDNRIYTEYLETYLGYMSDELLNTTSGDEEFYQNNYSSITNMVSRFWEYPYKTIFQCNDFILNVDGNSVISEAEADIYLSEARFFRAYSYFLLVNLFGDVPLVLTNDFREAALVPRTTKDEVYKQIIEDLSWAETHLKDSSNPKTKITADAAKALLARVYLYIGKWQAAVDKSKELIPVSDGGGNKSSLKLESLENVFKTSSCEGILFIDMAGYSGSGTYEGYTRIGNLFIPSSKKKINYYLNETLVNTMTDNDKRRKSWIGSLDIDGKVYYYPFKYKNRSTPEKADDAEYMVLLRLAEQYLIQAESLVRLDKVDEGIGYLNKIRHRAGLDELPDNTSKDDVLKAIEDERRRELFLECGHRWFDLNRTERANDVYKDVSYKTYWKDYKTLLPLPENELGRNRSLVQNDGY